METFAYLQITQDYEKQDYEKQDYENLAVLEPEPDLGAAPITWSENQAIQFVWKHFERLKAFCKLSSPALFWLVGLLSTTLIAPLSITSTAEAATETSSFSSGFSSGSGIGIVDLVNLNPPAASTTTSPATTTTTSTTTSTTELPLNPAPVTPVVAVNSTPVNSANTTSAIATRYFSRGDQGADVVRIQEQLRREGLFNATSTGFFGTITELAVMDFQADNGLVSDGVVGPQTFAILNRIQPAAILPSSTVLPTTPPANTTVQTTTVQTTTKPTVAASASLKTPLSLGDRGDNVAALQRYLKDLNYYTGEIDGIYNLDTERAVRGLQRTLGLTVDGVYGTQTIQRISV
jgi:peptidoglycan hydrolase-like protein with peptidoglycan-binding domain